MAHNQLQSLDNCHSVILPALTSLDLSYNRLNNVAKLQCLANCNSLSVLDLSYNRIGDVLVVKVLAAMANLRVLTMHGNPVIGQIPNYRKTMILECVSFKNKRLNKSSNKRRFLLVAALNSNQMQMGEEKYGIRMD